MRHKRLMISVNLITELCKAFHPGPSFERIKVTGNSVPDDARIVSVTQSRYWPDTVEVLLESDSFPDIAPGEIVPDLTPQLCVIRDPSPAWMKRREVVESALQMVGVEFAGKAENARRWMASDLATDLADYLPPFVEDAG